MAKTNKHRELKERVKAPDSWGYVIGTKTTKPALYYRTNSCFYKWLNS